MQRCRLPIMHRDAALRHNYPSPHTCCPSHRRRHPARGPPPPPTQLPLLNGPDAMRRSALALPPPQRSGIAVSQLWVADGRVLQLHADRTGVWWVFGSLVCGCCLFAAICPLCSHARACPLAALTSSGKPACQPPSCHPPCLSLAASTGRWLAASRPDLGAFTFSSSLLPDASAASLDPDPLPPRPLAGSWAAPGAAGAPPSASSGGSSGGSSGSGASQAAPGQALFAVAHGDKVLLSGGYFDGSLRWVGKMVGRAAVLLPRTAL